ncbi:MAG TPA: CDP-alcohol phosphatidyltransferase family protein [Allosphingosinicella sp.]|nr:CDP-alcohol phosphatidyltransferase family protein [Allosphingosinicella sp.]
MDEGPAPKIAVVTFRSAGEAGREVAGVAAAARIARALAEAGLAEARLAFPAGEEPDEALLAEIGRVAGSLKIEVASGDRRSSPAGPEAENLVFLEGNRLLPAAAIADLAAGRAVAGDAQAIDLDRAGASGEILRLTGKAGDGPVSRWLNRPLSRRMTALMVRIPGLRPIHATAGTALLALLMFVALVAGGAGGLIAGALLCQAASVFDGVDGELARATFRTSRAGAVLDSVVDVATNILFILGLTINLALSGHEWAFPLAAWGFALFVFGLATIAWRASLARGPFSLNLVKHHYRQRFPGPPIRWLISFFTIVSSRDFFALLFAVLVVVGLPMAVLYLFAAAATIWILFVVGSLRMTRDRPLTSPGA